MKQILFLFMSFLFSSVTFGQVVRTVSSPFDSGKGTLREVIGLCTTGDTVRFSITGTITLTNGSISFKSGIYIDGPGKDSLKVSGGGKYTVFSITGGSSTIKGISIIDADGYGISYTSSTDTLSIEDCQISDCYNEYSSGSAMYVGNSKLTRLVRTIFDGNKVYGDGISSVRGGAVYMYASSSIMVDGCTFKSNTAQSLNWGSTGSKAEGYGGAIYCSTPDLQLSNSIFTSNTATGSGCCGYNPNWSTAQGGALFFYGDKMQMENCDFRSNWVSSSDFRNYRLNQGNAVFLDNVDTVTINNSTFRFNTSSGGSYVNLYGGCIYANLRGQMNISKTIISKNSSQELGAICVNAAASGKGKVVIDGCKIDSNTVSKGNYPSAVFCTNIESLEVVNTSITGNPQSGIWTNGVGQVKVKSSLFDDNYYHIYLNNPKGSDNLVLNSTFRNSLNKAIYYSNTSSNYVTNNTFVNNNGDVYLSNGAALFTNNIFTYDKFISNAFSRSGTEVPLSGGGNIVKGSSFSSYFTKSNDKNSRDPELDSFANHGGPTKCYSLLSKSQAIDLGGKDSLLEDQRGFIRDSLTDAGAFEYGAVNPYLIVFDTLEGKSNLCVGDTLKLEVIAKGKIDQYAWFKNGTLIKGETTSILTIDSVFVGDSGTYVCVMRNSMYSDTSTAIALVVNPYPTVIASGTDTICTEDSALLTASGADFYSWNQMAGDTSEVYVSPMSSTVYTVIGTSKGCSTLDSVVISVDTTPTVVAMGSDTICAGESVVISANGANSYSWSRGAGDTSHVQVRPTITTTYVVTGITKECPAMDSVTIYVNPIPVVTASKDTTICNGGSATIGANGADEFVWNQSAGTGGSITVSPSSTTEYIVTGNSKGCESTDSVVVYVNPIPAVSASADTSICEGGSAWLSGSGADSYEWDQKAGNKENVQVSPTQTTTYTVKGTSKGCSATDAVLVTVNPIPMVTVSKDTSICAGEMVDLRADGADSYLWDNGGGDKAIARVMPSSTTTYTVYGTSLGCSASEEVVVTVKASPIVMVVANDSSVCDSGTVILSATGASNYKWDNDLGNGSSVLAKVHATTTFSAWSTSNGCTGKGQVTIEVFESPDPPILKTGGMLETGLYASYQWLLNGNEIDGATERTFEPLSNGDYSVLVEEENGCSGISSTIIKITDMVGVTGVDLDRTYIFPNPASEFIYIQAKDEAGVEIYNALGMLVLRQPLRPNAQNVVKVDSLNQGFYTVLLVGSQTKISRLIVYR